MNSGVCSVNQLSNTFTCTCANYYYGNRCECMRIHVYLVASETCVLCYLAVNQCFTQPPCQNGGTCTPGPSNTFTCQCLSLYTGTFCEQSKTPSSTIHDLTHVNNGIKRLTIFRYLFLDALHEWCHLSESEQQSAILLSMCPRIFRNNLQYENESCCCLCSILLRRCRQ